VPEKSKKISADTKYYSQLITPVTPQTSTPEANFSSLLEHLVRLRLTGGGDRDYEDVVFMVETFDSPI
jgi:hypothetical protein